MTMRLLLSTLLGALLALPAAHAAKKTDDEAKWDVNAPRGKTVRARFTVEEGTWMNLDVSPDGQTIVFDLLGDLYTLPIEGGQARRIASGKALQIQPQFSPDGRRIAYTSDAGGGDNIWLMNADGSQAKALTAESFRLLNNPNWSPDGQYVVARKHFTELRSLGAGEMWLYHTGASDSSGREGLQLTKRKNEQQDAGEPVFSPDGRYVYFSEDVSRGPTFQYNKNPHEGIYAIRRLDRDNGELIDLIRLPGGAVRPQPSPDGRSLAFVRRVGDKSVLSLFDLKTGDYRPLWDGLSHDQQEAWAIFGVYPNYDFTPDGQSIVIWAQGKLWRVDVASGQASQIPFSADVDQTLDEPVRASRRIDDAPFQARMIRDVARSPDGSELLFHAAGSLYRMALPNGAPERLTDDSGFEYSPDYAPDGSAIVYVRFDDRSLSQVVRLDRASGARLELTLEPGFYFNPRFSPDGSRVVYSKQTGGNLVDFRFGLETGVYWVNSAGGTPTRVARDGYDPRFSADGKRVQFLTGGGLEKLYKSVDLAGAEPREHFKLKYADQLVPSPDGKWIAWTELFNAYVAPFPDTGAAVSLGRDSKALPVRKLSGEAGQYLHWSGNNQSLHWLVGPAYYSRDLKDSFAFVQGAPEKLPEAGDLKPMTITLSLPTAKPQGQLALVGARLLTQHDGAVIDDGTIIVDGNRISAIGPSSEVSVPAGARRIDVQGKTIMPGIIDVHAHANHFFNGPSAQQNWSYYANLAYGVTTTHDPSANTQEVFTQAEMVRSGVITGPRVYSTGTILYGADGDFRAMVDSLDDARHHLKRLKAQGAWSVKSYNQPRRDQRQQINQAARELGMIVVMEGGSTFFHNLSMIIDGSTGVEHNLPVAPLYADMIGLWSRTQVGNTPTLVVAYGGLSGEYWWYEHSDVWQKQRLLNFFPSEALDGRSIRRQKAPESEYFHITVSESVNALRQAGVPIMVGGHGQMQGLGTLWEMWLIGQGGMPNAQVLEAGTIAGARYLGLDADLGSLEVGKLADLLVLPGNPLEDLMVLEQVEQTMVNGQLFDSQTMAQIAPVAKPAPEFYWQRHGVGRAQAAGFGRMGPTAVCHCPKGAHP
ncbi:MAG: amidohydrolase family protein [Lysobacterales bacterium]